MLWWLKYTYVDIYVCVCMCVYICMHIYILMCVCVHVTHKHTENFNLGRESWLKTLSYPSFHLTFRSFWIMVWDCKVVCSFARRLMTFWAERNEECECGKLKWVLKTISSSFPFPSQRYRNRRWEALRYFTQGSPVIKGVSVKLSCRFHFLHFSA